MISNLKKYGVYFLVGVIGGITVILFGLILQNNIEMTEIIKITISIIALFSTFGGAYLGAKISGEANIKLEKQRQSEEYKKEAFTLKNKIVEYINKIEKNLCSLDKNYETFVINLFNENEENDLPFEEEEELLFFLKYFYEERNNVDLQMGELLSNSFIFSLKENDKEFYKNLLEYRRLFSDIAHYTTNLLEYKNKNKNMQKYNEFLKSKYDDIDIDIKKFTKLSVKLKKAIYNKLN